MLEIALDVLRFLLRIFGVSLEQQERYIENVRARFRDKSATIQPKADEDANIAKLHQRLDEEEKAKNGQQ